MNGTAGDTASVYRVCNLFRDHPELSYQQITIRESGRIEITAEGTHGVLMGYARAMPDHVHTTALVPTQYGLDEADVIESSGIVVTIRRPLRVRLHDEGRIAIALAIIVAGVGLFLLGFTHAASTPGGAWTPDGRWLLGLAIVGAVVLLLATGFAAYRRRERADAEYTRRMEARLKDERSAAQAMAELLQSLLLRMTRRG